MTAPFHSGAADGTPPTCRRRGNCPSNHRQIEIA